jgi:CBS domain-containing protein
MIDPYGPIETVMSSPAVTVTADTTLDHVLKLFEKFTGLPVVDEGGRCIGIISNIDVAKHARKRADGSLPTTKVLDIMTTPAFVIVHHAPVAYAAGLMLKHKVHRLPVVDKDGVVLGIVTRTDVFEPLTEGSSRFLHFIVGERKRNLPIISF